MTSSPPVGIEPRHVELVLAQVEGIPRLAPTVASILACSADTPGGARRLVRLVTGDPSLAARVLSVFVKAHPHLSREDLTVVNAVELLGIEVVRGLAITRKAVEALASASSSREPNGPCREEFWKHCLAVACAARRIATAVPSSRVHPEEAFLLGMLHDLGKAALDAVLPKSYAKAVRRCVQPGSEIVSAERAVLGVDHTVVGRRLAERWGLPRRMVEVVWLHHQLPEALPASIAAGRHVEIVQIADTIAREQRIGWSGNLRFGIHSKHQAAAIGLSEKDWLAIVESIGDEVEARGAWIGGPETDGRTRALFKIGQDLATADTTLGDENPRLRRKSDCYAARDRFNRHLSSRCSVREVCAAGAEAFLRALGVRAVLLLAGRPDASLIDVGLADGAALSEVEPPLGGVELAADDLSLATQFAAAGSWVVPPGRSFDGWIDRYRGRLGDGPVWHIPIVRAGVWEAGALFAADPEVVAALQDESAEIVALGGDIGLAFAQAKAQAAAAAFSEELVESNRRFAATRDDAIRYRTFESLGAMAAGAAHELNNPLAVISGRAQLLKARAADPELRDGLDSIAHRAQACSNIVTELMEFAQPAAPAPQQNDLGECLRSLKTDLTTRGLLEDAALSVEVASDTPLIWFDPARLSAMFRELVQNALDATDPIGRRLTIKVAPDLTEKTVVVRFSDNGRGMTPDVLGRAMDPFFSHRPAGRKRGLGLARVGRWLADGHGSIRIDSAVGQGTQVEIKLPAAAGDST